MISLWVTTDFVSRLRSFCSIRKCRVPRDQWERAADLSDIYRGAQEALRQAEGHSGPPQLVLPGRDSVLNVCVYTVSDLL